VTVSEDVVLVEKNNVLKAAGWPLILNIGVVLGQDVQINGYGLKGLVNGRLRIKTSPDEQLNGSGEISLKDGTFTIYGRSLDIVRGRLLFTGGAIDNPGVDARAQKKVSDEEAKGQGYTVGVDISGLVQDLQYHLFSDPSMEDTEIVSRMLVGHSFADSNAEEGGLLKKALVTLGVHSSNVLVDGLGSILTVDDFHLEGSRNKEDTSLVLGKRLTEDLYIGYDVNMFSQLGSFRVRYDLKHGFVVETTSSSEATGADLMYSFQR
jgi:translocation and assembly module TamB